MFYIWKRECERNRLRAAKSAASKKNPVDVTGDSGGQAQPSAATVAPKTAQQQSQVEAAAGGFQPVEKIATSAVAARYLAIQAAQAAREAAKEAEEECDMLEGQMATIKQEGQGGMAEGSPDGDDGGDGVCAEDQRARDEEKYGEMPANWIHPHSLVFALFGRPAGESEDVDLKMKMSGGGKTGAAATAAVGGGGGGKGSAAQAYGLGKSDLATLAGAGCGAGGKQSRAEVKKERHAANSEAKRDAAAAATAKFRADALMALSAPVDAPESTKQLASSVMTLTANLVKKQKLDEEAAARDRWTFLKNAKKDCWEEFVAMGLEHTAAGEVAKQEYIALLSNVPGSMTQSGVAGGAIDGGGGGGAAGEAIGAW